MLRDLVVWNERVRNGASEQRTSVDDGVSAFTDFLVFYPIQRSRWSTRTSREGDHTIVSGVPRWLFRLHPSNAQVTCHHKGMISIRIAVFRFNTVISARYRHLRQH